MRIHQPGSHLTDRRGAEVDDWLARRGASACFAGLTRPYKA